MDYVEDHYNLVHRDVEKTVWPYLKENHIQFVPYFPLASGLLTGKYTIEDANKFSGWAPDAFEVIINNLEKIKSISEKHQATVAQTILSWYIANPEISVVIPGARVPEQVANNVAALKVTLSPQEYQTIDHLFGQF